MMAPHSSPLVKFELTKHMREAVDTHLAPKIAEQTEV